MLCSAWLGTAWRCFALHCIALPGTPARARAPRKAKGLPACPPARLPLCGGPAEPRLASRGGGLPGPGPRRQGDPHPSRKALGPSASPPLRGWGVGVPGGGGGPAACHTGAADLAGTTRPATPPRAGLRAACGLQGPLPTHSTGPAVTKPGGSCPRGPARSWGASAGSGHCPLGEISPRKPPPHPPSYLYLAACLPKCPLSSPCHPLRGLSTPPRLLPRGEISGIGGGGDWFCRRGIESLPF